jgi:hypothetical protein
MRSKTPAVGDMDGSTRAKTQHARRVMMFVIPEVE